VWNRVTNTFTGLLGAHRVRWMPKLMFLAAILAISPAFATAPPRAMVSANTSGNRALDAERYEVAIKDYEKALRLAEDAGDVQYRAIAMYGLARANARLCRTTLAEKWFRDSISLRESIPDVPKSAFLTQNWIEFARFLLSLGRAEEAATYFERAVPKLESMGIDQIDPIGYADLLDDAVATLTKIGKTEEARAHVERAAELRQNNPDRKAGFRALPYSAACAAEAH
jgi:tetratricopeptide (TPR) repeat protein